MATLTHLMDLSSELLHLIHLLHHLISFFFALLLKLLSTSQLTLSLNLLLLLFLDAH